MDSRRDVIDEEVEDQITSVSSYLKALKSNPGGLSFPTGGSGGVRQAPWRRDSSSGLGRQRASRYEELSGSLNNVKHAEAISRNNNKVSNSIKDIQGMLNNTKQQQQTAADHQFKPKYRMMTRPPMELPPPEPASSAASTGESDAQGSCGDSTVSDTVSCSGSEVAAEELLLSNPTSPKSSFVNRVHLDPSCSKWIDSAPSVPQQKQRGADTLFIEERSFKR